MDKLKNFIDANRDAFKEDEMLPEGHFERFEQKLPKPRKKPCGPIQPIGLCHSCLYRFVALIPLAGRDRSAGTRAKDHGPDLRDPRGDRGTTPILQYANERRIGANEEVV